MSKPISFGFGKSKNSTPVSSAPSTPKPISLSTTARHTNGTVSRANKAKLRDESDDEDEVAPQAEAVTGFSSSGAILTRSREEKKERIIPNSGNGDWRKRGRTNLLPAEVQLAQQVAQQNGGEVITVERQEVSTTSGLQYAASSIANNEPAENGTAQDRISSETEKPLTEDEKALQALLDDGTGKPKSSAVIETKGNARLQQRDEAEDFRADVACRPDSSTLEDYAAMPVEEFGLAMLRGMGQKRRANGEIIQLDSSKDEKKDTKKQRKQEGFLGIGAKPAPGMDGIELGAWGKAEMRKNNKGQGFFTPVMMEDKRTGERMTEDEFEKRRKEAGRTSKDYEADWRERRDKNLERDGRDRSDGEVNGSRRRDREDREHQSRSRRDRDSNEEHGSSRSRRNQDREDEYDSSRSRRDRERSRSSERKRDRHRYRDQERYRDDDRYDSSSPRRSGHRNRDRERESDSRRHGDRDRDRR